MKLKVCGMRQVDNIMEVAMLAPDYMGFIFYPHSKRFVGDNFSIPAISSEIKKVGVFVNSSLENVLSKVERYKLDFVQLHGDESVAFCESISKSVKVIKAFGIDENFDFDGLHNYNSACTYFLFDTKTKEYGGSGQSFDLSLLDKYKGKKEFFLSGGISLDFFSDKKTTDSRLLALDVNSKFELSPGLKDINKLKIFKNELSGK